MFVFPDELGLFEEECQMIFQQSHAIAEEIWSNPARGERIQEYMVRFLAAAELARERGAGVSIT